MLLLLKAVCRQNDLEPNTSLSELDSCEGIPREGGRKIKRQMSACEKMRGGQKKQLIINAIVDERGRLPSPHRAYFPPESPS